MHIGQAVLVENMAEDIDPLIAPLVAKRYFKKGGIECVQLGEVSQGGEALEQSRSHTNCPKR